MLGRKLFRDRCGLLYIPIFHFIGKSYPGQRLGKNEVLYLFSTLPAPGYEIAGFDYSFIFFFLSQDLHYDVLAVGVSLLVKNLPDFFGNDYTR